MHIVLFEAGGKQSFIFDTNRLSDAVGASELIHQSGTSLAAQAFAKVSGKKLRDDFTYKDSGTYPPLEEDDFNIVSLSSGRAVFAVPTMEDGARMIRELTLLVRKNIPGLKFSGATSKISFDWKGNKLVLHEAIVDAARQLAIITGSVAGEEARCSQLPFVDICNKSAYPASAFINAGAESEAISSVRLKKRQARKAWRERLQELLLIRKAKYSLPSDPLQLETHFQTLDWWAVVHADGNNMGKLFVNFDKLLLKSAQSDISNKEYCLAYREFSQAIDAVCERSFILALEELESVSKKTRKGREILPIVPLVLGGDDFTAICAGRYALNFAQAFLRHFELCSKDASKNNIINRIVCADAKRAKGLSACAGISIIKPHYPFHFGYLNASDLIANAKTVKQKISQVNDGLQASALDIHVAFESTNTDITEFRKRYLNVREAGQNYSLTSRPYVVTEFQADDLKEMKEQSVCWLKAHSFTKLAHCIKKVKSGKLDGTLPGSQLQYIREGFGLSVSQGIGRFERVKRRYKKLSDLTEAKGSLFVELNNCDGNHSAYTKFIDCLELNEFYLADKT